MVRSFRLLISFYPIILFEYTSIVKNSCVLPKEVLEVKGASGNLLAFVKAKDKMGV